MELQQAIQESQMAIDYFFNNRFEQARALMKPELSIYHSVGHSVFLFLEAMLTFVRILIKLSLSPNPFKYYEYIIYILIYILGTPSHRNCIEFSQTMPSTLQ